MNLAIFDLDHTLLPLDSDQSWGRFLVREGAVDGEDYGRRNAAFYQDYLAGTLDTDAYLLFVFEAMAGIPRTQLENLRATFIKTVVEPTILPEVRALLQKHRNAGDLIAIATATNRFVAEPIAAALGVEHLLAVTPEVRADGSFTGQIDGINSSGANKLVHVHAWLARLDKRLEDFPTSYAYSDSDADLPLLCAVTHPVATNPNARLMAHARQRGWAQLTFFDD